MPPATRLQLPPEIGLCVGRDTHQLPPLGRTRESTTCAFASPLSSAHMRFPCWQVAGASTAKNAVNACSRTTEAVGNVGSKSHQPTAVHIVTLGIDCWDAGRIHDFRSNSRRNPGTRPVAANIKAE